MPPPPVHLLKYAAVMVKNCFLLFMAGSAILVFHRMIYYMNYQVLVPGTVPGTAVWASIFNLFFIYYRCICVFISIAIYRVNRNFIKTLTA